LCPFSGCAAQTYWFLRMRLIRNILLLGTSGVVLTSCLGDNVGPPGCEPTPWTIATTIDDTVTTTTGLRYIEGEQGLGAGVEWCQTVSIHYDGYLLDGTLIESSRPALGSITFRPGTRGLIDGIEQGVIGVRLGGTRRLIIPPGLAFGAQARLNAAGQVIVPPNSTVVYDIEVVEIGP